MDEPTNDISAIPIPADRDGRCTRHTRTTGYPLSSRDVSTEVTSAVLASIDIGSATIHIRLPSERSGPAGPSTRRVGAPVNEAREVGPTHLERSVEGGPPERRERQTPYGGRLSSDSPTCPVTNGGVGTELDGASDFKETLMSDSNEDHGMVYSRRTEGGGYRWT